MKTYSKGIVLRAIDYSETSAIVKIFTHNHGVRSFMVRGVKGKRRKTGYLQPLSLIEIEYHLHERKDLSVAGNIRFLDGFHSIPVHPHKRMVALFLAEVLNETLKGDHVDEPLFNFIHSRLLLFDLEEWNANFHLFFMASMTRFLGFYPLLTPGPKGFDPEGGAFTTDIWNSLVVTGPEVSLLFSLFTEDWEEVKTMQMNRQTRSSLTTRLIDFYRYHSADMRSLKSLQILSEILDD